MKLLIAVNTLISISLATAITITEFGTGYGSSCDPKIESESCICDMVNSIPDIYRSIAFPFYSCPKGKCFKANDGTGAEGCLQIPNGSFTCNDCAASEGDDNESVSGTDTSSTSVTDTSSTFVIGTSSETKTSTSSETITSTSTMESSASIHTYPVISVLAMLIILPLYF